MMNMNMNITSVKEIERKKRIECFFFHENTKYTNQVFQHIIIYTSIFLCDMLTI